MSWSIDDDMDGELIDLIEEISARFERGEVVDHEEYCKAHPQHADQLARILPTLQLLADLTDNGQATRGDTAGDTSASSIGEFRIVRELGRGGMGIVYEAEQLSLGRLVALKVLPLAGMLDERQLQRFKNEARAAATLSHPNIVPVFAVGSDRGVHFYAMQLISGPSVDEVIQELRNIQGKDDKSETVNATSAIAQRLHASALATCAMVKEDASVASPKSPSVPSAGDGVPVAGRAPDNKPASAETNANQQVSLATERSELHSKMFFWNIARLGVQIAEALQHAHEQGVVHRDIKPGNLILDAEGKVWITDFGLAHLQHEVGNSVSGDVVGTLRYMSPERVLGRSTAVDSGTDIYSLGVTLYEMLTLQPAFAGHDRQGLLLRIANEIPTAPRQRNRAIPRDLETIVLKAMAKERPERYDTAAELAHDLRCFLEQRPIKAKPPSPIQQVFKWSQRHQPAVVATAVVMLLLIIGLIFNNRTTVHQHNEVTKAYNIADTQRQMAELNLDVAMQSVNELLGTLVRDQLKDVPQMQAVRAEMADRAVAMLNTLADQNPESPSIQQVMAEGYLQLGRLYHMVGDNEKGEAALRQGMSLCEKLLSRSSMNAEARLTLANSYNQLGLLLRADGRFADAETTYKCVSEVLQPLMKEADASDGVEQIVAKTHMNLGRVLNDKNDFRAAEEEYKKALAIDQRRVRRDGSFANRHSLALTLLNLGGMQWQLSKLEAAEQTTRTACAMFQDLAEELPSNKELRDSLAHTTNNLGAILQSSGKKEEAVSAFRDHITVAERLVKDFPNIPKYRDNLAVGYGNLGPQLRSLGDLQGSEEATRSAVATLRPLVEEYPNVIDYRVHLASYTQNLGLLLMQLEQREEAIDCYRQAIDLNEAIVAEHPQVTEYSETLVRHLWNLVIALAQTGYGEESEKAGNRMVDVLIALASNDPNERPMSPDTITRMSTMARIYASGHNRSTDHFVQAIALCRGVIRSQPDNGDAWRTLGVAQCRAEEWQDAVDSLEKSLRLRGGGEGSVFFYLAKAYHHLGDTANAHQWHAEGAKWMKENKPDDPELQQFRDESAALLGIKGEHTPGDDAATSDLESTIETPPVNNGSTSFSAVKNARANPEMPPL